jgi:hypothetical protein
MCSRKSLGCKSRKVESSRSKARLYQENRLLQEPLGGRARACCRKREGLCRIPRDGR